MRNKVAKFLIVGLTISTIITGCGKKDNVVESSIEETTLTETIVDTSSEEIESEVAETTSTKKVDYKVEIQTSESVEESEAVVDFVPEKSEEGRWMKGKNGSWNFILNSTNTEAKDIAIKVGDKAYYFNSKGELENEGWAKNTSGIWVYVKNNKFFKGWIDNTYYTDESGMATGLKEIDGTTYYFDENGAVKDGWVQLENKWYFTEQGKVVVGITSIDGITYGFSAENGMLTGLNTIEDKKYYFNNDGTAGQGIVDIDGKKYYCEKGEVKTGKIPVSGAVYKFGTDGVMVTEEFVNGTYINSDGTADSKKKVTNVGSLADKDGLDGVLNKLPSKLVEEYFITNSWKLIYDTTATGSMEEIEGTGAVSFNNKFMKFHNVDTIYHRFGHYIEYANGVTSENSETLKNSEFSSLGLDEYFNKSGSEYFAEACGLMLNKTDISVKATETDKFIKEVLKKYE